MKTNIWEGKWKESEVAQSCPTLGDPVDCSPPLSSVHGTFQARVLEWAAISFSRGSSWPRYRTQVSCIVSKTLYRLSRLICFLRPNSAIGTGIKLAGSNWLINYFASLMEVLVLCSFLRCFQHTFHEVLTCGWQHSRGGHLCPLFASCKKKSFWTKAEARTVSYSASVQKRTSERPLGFSCPVDTRPDSVSKLV